MPDIPTRPDEFHWDESLWGGPPSGGVVGVIATLTATPQPVATLTPTPRPIATLTPTPQPVATLSG